MVKLALSRFKISLIITLLLLITMMCKDNDEIPNVYVNILISLNDSEFSALHAVGNHVDITGGVNGIIVYRFSDTEFYAYERTCTFTPSDNCRVFADVSNTFMQCLQCCQSTFLMIDGSVVEGPATKPLRQYHTSFDGTNILIYN